MSAGGGGQGGASAGGGGQGGAGGVGGAGGGGGGCAVQCDDGLYCNGVEACVNGQCVAGSSPCDDGVGCTVDACDDNLDACTHVPTNMLCDNGVQCDGSETCDAQLDCQSGQAPSCDDGVTCTSDFCDQTLDACQHVPNDVVCSDGLVCTGVETCDVIADCQPGTPPVCNDNVACTTNSCNEQAGGCIFTPIDSACNDGQFCNGVETCSAQGCQPGTPPSCDDGVDCTADSCSVNANACLHTTNDSFCDDGVYCNGTESCSATLDCVTTGPVSCPSDGVGCTVEACDEIAQDCASTPNAGLCPGGEFCSPVLDCIPAPPCLDDAECQDGDLCNGVETCEGETPNVPDSGICTAGAPVVCDDLVNCTIDSCDPGTGTCSYLANDAYCENGFNCDGAETCDPTQGCLIGTAIDCDDGIGCTDDGCYEPGICLSFGNNAQCDDGNVCNGAETCDDTQGCQPGSSNNVCADDGVACTVELCDDQLGCQHIPDDSLCPCGQTCDPVNDCGNTCVVATCQGKVYACGDCIDNDGDCSIDSNDTQCLGPCDNTEDSFYGGIPGQNNSPCKSDCYFDQDTGSGNDDCYWSHKCDPLEVAPNYPPEGSQCEYNPSANIPGYSGTCAQAYATQSATCGGYCGPLTPNGCDCFGCCAIPGAPTTVWLGSENPSGTGSCNLANLANPAMCKPCTQVAACLNECDTCEICVGQPELPPECSEQVCEGGEQPCGQPGQDPCGAGFFCITGCCQPLPT